MIYPNFTTPDYVYEMFILIRFPTANEEVKDTANDERRYALKILVIIKTGMC